MSRKKSIPSPANDSQKETRTRAWTFVLYEDSAPERWQLLLDEFHIQWVESPWHDRDINGDGSPKKKHKHILLAFETVKSYEQVFEITKSLNAPIPQRCHDMRALVRYMAHIDNPEKAQYSIDDIIGHGGFDVGEMFKASSSERYSLIGDMFRYIRENKIIEFQDLVDYAMDNHLDWFKLLCDNSSFIVEKYIASARHRCTSEAVVCIDKSTGEVIS